MRRAGCTSAAEHTDVHEQPAEHMDVRELPLRQRGKVRDESDMTAFTALRHEGHSAGRSSLRSDREACRQGRIRACRCFLSFSALP